MASTFRAGGRELQLLPFTIGTAEALFLLADKAAGLTEMAAISNLVEMVAVGVKRGNQDATAAWLRENVELGELRPLFAAMMAAGGMRSVPAGEAPSQ